MNVGFVPWLSLLGLSATTSLGVPIAHSTTPESDQPPLLVAEVYRSSQTKVVTDRPSDKTPDFQEILEAFAKEHNIVIIAEGYPKPRAEEKVPNSIITSGTLTVAATAKDDRSVSLEAEIQQFANKYDYKSGLLKSSRNVYVLKKLYSYVDDLPGVTIEECSASAEDLVRVLSVCSPKIDPVEAAIGRPFTLDLIKTLSAEQMNALQQGTLRVGSLSPEQRSVVSRTALYIYLDIPSTDAKSTALFFKSALSTGVISRNNPSQVLGLEGVGPASRPFFWPLPSFSSQSIGLPSDSAASSDSALKTPNKVNTLASVVKMFNNAALSVDPALAGKPVTVAGLERATPAETMAALADVYGLRTFTTKEGQVRLTRPALRLPRSFSELPKAVHACIPRPLLAALHDLDADVAPPPTAAPANTSATPPATFEEFVKQDQERQALSEKQRQRQPTAEAIVSEAAKQVRISVEPSIKKMNIGERIAVANLDLQTRSALGIAMMSNVMRSLKVPFKQQGPDYITRFDDLYLKGGPYEEKGQQMVSVYLEVRDPATNKLLNSVGVSNVKVP